MAYTTIKKPSDYFNTKLYTGTGTTNTAITGVGFQPDWVWIKNRSSAQEHRLHDAVRGANKLLRTNSSGAEATTSQDVMSFDSNGFTVGTEPAVNGSGNSLVAWNWLGANGTASNTDGSITSTVSANTTSGFSIVTYTGNGTAGATVGHGLGVTPSVVICKNRSAGSNSWGVYHKSMGTNLMFLDAGDAAASYSTIYNNTAPSSSVVTLGSGGNANGNSQNIILYCFAERKGFSAMGSYVGNGSTDGPFIFTTFKPAFVLVKNTTQAAEWEIYDNKRAGYNPANYHLNAQDNSVEAALDNRIDLLSNGFKVRTAPSGPINTSGNTYIFMAFAEEPLVGDNPATAR